jgi:hypothetical protein
MEAIQSSQSDVIETPVQRDEHSDNEMNDLEDFLKTQNNSNIVTSTVVHHSIHILIGEFDNITKLDHKSVFTNSGWKIN